MGRNAKIIGLIAVLVAGFFAYKTFFAAKPDAPAKTETARAEAAKPASNEPPTLEMNETEVGAIKIAKVESAPFTPYVTAVGNIDFNQNLLVQVFTPYQGRIIKPYPNVGDKVSKGDVLFTIDSPDLLNAESTLIAADGVLKLQNLTLKRQQQMKSFGGASQQAVDQSTSDQQTAESALKSARDAVRIFGKTDAEIDAIIAARKADPVLVVRSPIDGYVTTRTASPGLLVQPGSPPPVYTVADLSTMWMLANVVETDAPQIAVGEEVKASVQAFPNKTFDGKVVVVGPSVDPNSRRVFVRMEVADPERNLRAGMLANFVIFTGPAHQSASVPEVAVVREGDGSFTAWVTEDNHKFTRRILKLGSTQNGLVEILDGLKPGEKVVTDGAVFVANKFALAGNSAD